MMTGHQLELVAETGYDKFINIRRRLHQYPELSNEEFETTKSIRAWLEEAEIRILDYPLATGVVAEVGGRKPGPVIALRADIDALLRSRRRRGCLLPPKSPGKCMPAGMISIPPR